MDMTEQEIRQAIFDLQEEKDIIKSQVNGAKKAKAEGIFCDRKWLNSAEHAGRIKGRQIAQLQVALGAVLKSNRKKDAEERDISFERQFMIKARDILPRSLYEQVIGETVSVVEARK